MHRLRASGAVILWRYCRVCGPGRAQELQRVGLDPPSSPPLDLGGDGRALSEQVGGRMAKRFVALWHKSGHISINLRRQKLSIGASGSWCGDASF